MNDMLAMKLISTRNSSCVLVNIMHHQSRLVSLSFVFVFFFALSTFFVFDLLFTLISSYLPNILNCHEQQ